MLVAVDVHKLIALRKKAKLTQCRLSILAELPSNAVYRIESQSTFCNKTSKVCEIQKNEGEFCEDSWECKNYLGCYKNSCIKYGSLKANMKNTEKVKK